MTPSCENRFKIVPNTVMASHSDDTLLDNSQNDTTQSDIDIDDFDSEDDLPLVNFRNLDSEDDLPLVNFRNLADDVNSQTQPTSNSDPAAWTSTFTHVTVNNFVGNPGATTVLDANKNELDFFCYCLILTCLL